MQSVAGASYAQQLRDVIFRPLGLRHTMLPTQSDGLPDVHGYLALSAYDPNASTAPIDTASLSPAFAWSAGAIRSTAEEVADFTGRSSPASCSPGPRSPR